MNELHSILYVMRHIDTGGHVEIPYKKIGITGAGNATLTSRLQQISNTKSPIQAQCIAAWKHEDAKSVEIAVHRLLEDSREEGEWFYDKDDTLVERMLPLMELLGAEFIPVGEPDDAHTKTVLKRESDSKRSSNQALLGEISELLRDPLRTSIRQGGPTLFSDKTNLTYYIGYRKSGRHTVAVGRSNKVFDELSDFLEVNGFEVEQHAKGHAVITGLSVEMIAEFINTIESSFTSP